MKNKISIWTQAYRTSIGNLNGYKQRLKELRSWDKPLIKKEDDKQGLWAGWARKCLALEDLIEEAKQAG